jgi:hypothetical protein
LAAAKGETKTAVAFTVSFIVSFNVSDTVSNRGLPEDEKENKLIRASRILIRNINNFIPGYLIVLEPDMNVKPYEPLTFFPVIRIEYKISLVYNLIIVCCKDLEGMSCCAYFPAK